MLLGSTNILRILGDSDDTVSAAGFVKSTKTATKDSVTYDVYDVNAALWIQQDITTVL